MNSKTLMIELDAGLNSNPDYAIDTQQLAYELCQELTRVTCSRKIRMYDYTGMWDCVSSINNIYLAFRKLAQKKYKDFPRLVGDDVLTEDLFIQALPSGYDELSEVNRLYRDSRMRGTAFYTPADSLSIVQKFITNVLMGRYPIDSRAVDGGRNAQVGKVGA